jgi:hypothetical protein
LVATMNIVYIIQCCAFFKFWVAILNIVCIVVVLLMFFFCVCVERKYIFVHCQCCFVLCNNNNM